MLSDFLHTLVEFIQYLWPFHIVLQWERALYLVCGRVWREVGPGLYPKIPWICDLHPVNIAWEVAGTSRHDITTKDGKALSFVATTMFRVQDVRKAVVGVHEYAVIVQSILASVLAEAITEIDPERLVPEKRKRLNSSLEAMVHAECAEIGIEVKWVRFTTFVANPKMLRLLGEHVAFVN